MNFLSFFYRWKYGFRIRGPSIKRSWSTAADLRESTSTALTLPVPPACPNFGRSRWRTKDPQCTQTITWTILATGTQTTTRTRTGCPGLRWCEWIVLPAWSSSAGQNLSAWTELNVYKCVCVCECRIEFVRILCIPCVCVSHRLSARLWPVAVYFLGCFFCAQPELTETWLSVFNEGVSGLRRRRVHPWSDLYAVCK